MYSQDDTDLDTVDNVQYDDIRNMYIKDKTKYPYQGANKSFLLWIF